MYGHILRGVVPSSSLWLGINSGSGSIVVTPSVDFRQSLQRDWVENYHFNEDLPLTFLLMPRASWTCLWCSNAIFCGLRKVYYISYTALVKLYWQLKIFDVKNCLNVEDLDEEYSKPSSFVTCLFRDLPILRSQNLSRETGELSSYLVRQIKEVLS